MFKRTRIRLITGLCGLCVFAILSALSVRPAIGECLFDGGMRHLPADLRFFESAELTRIDRSLRRIFYRSFPAPMRLEIVNLTRQTVNALGREAPAFFKTLNFLGALYVLGVIEFGDYQAIRALQPLSPQRSDVVRSRLRLLNDRYAEISRWYRDNVRPGWGETLLKKNQSLSKGHQQPYQFIKNIRVSDYSAIVEVKLPKAARVHENRLVIKVPKIERRLEFRYAIGVITRYLTRSEAVASYLIHDPRVIAPFGLIPTRDRQYMTVMPHLPEGLTMDKLIDKLPPKDMIGLFARGTRIVEACVERGVYHMDINPANFFVAANLKDVYLIDFGIAVFRDLNPLNYRLSARSHWIPQKLQRDKTPNPMNQYVPGTFDFMSPEMMYRSINPFDVAQESTLVYMLGTSLYHAFIRIPDGWPKGLDFYGYKEKMSKHSCAELDVISPRLSHLVRMSVTWKPEDRIQTVQEFLRTLESILQHIPD